MSPIMIITGGSRGIGAATARLAAQRGYAVWLTYRRDEESALAVVRDIERAGGRAHAQPCDVRQEREVQHLFADVRSRWGVPAALVNNAGITGMASRLDDADAETMQAVIDTNVMGPLFTCREAVRCMSTRHGGHGGSIVNVSSGAASIGSADTYVWYAASKAALDTVTLGLAREVAREGIRVNGVGLGFIDTEIHAAAGMPDRAQTLGPTLPIGRIGTPDEAAYAILWLHSKEASYVTGHTLRVAGGR
jgi:NAD(P)-dependent dehydrogenase (short-subunit alcohol dehydrogenase family)